MGKNIILVKIRIHCNWLKNKVQNLISGDQMKSWTAKGLETVSYFAVLKCKLTVVIRAC
jgi:hypothetical protein